MRAICVHCHDARTGSNAPSIFGLSIWRSLARMRWSRVTICTQRPRMRIRGPCLFLHKKPVSVLFEEFFSLELKAFCLVDMKSKWPMGAAVESKLRWKELKQAAFGTPKFSPLTVVTSMILACSVCFLILTLGLHSYNSCFFSHCACPNSKQFSSSSASVFQSLQAHFSQHREGRTSLANLVFGIAAASNVLDRRKEYIKSWWRPGEARGFVYVDEPVSNWSDGLLPELKVSENTSRFSYTFKNGRRSAIRISRIVSEMFRLGLPDVHWFVLGDDDTVFFVDNLVKVLSKYDHNKFYYVGSNSESHVQNVHGFSSNMAYGGGGFAISYPLAEALAGMQDECLERYHFLYGSDDRIQACMAELGVPLTREPGFHQLDILGDASGILSAHPIAPAISLHHLNIIQPLFPNMTREQSLKHLAAAVSVDPAGILQQSICYDRTRNLSIQVSWGYLVQVTRGLLFPKDLELPLRTFVGWYGESDQFSFPFKTRALSRDSCEQPIKLYMADVTKGRHGESVSSYRREFSPNGCSLSDLSWIHVEKDASYESWYEAPRRQCCSIIDTKDQEMHIKVDNCKQGEFAVW